MPLRGIPRVLGGTDTDLDDAECDDSCQSKLFDEKIGLLIGVGEYLQPTSNFFFLLEDPRFFFATPPPSFFC